MAGEKILIVEDEYITSEALKIVVEDMGYYAMKPVSSGEEAIKKATEKRPDLVLMDISLQGEMDGIEAADKIISELNIPVIYITAHSSRDTVDRACKTAFSDYIVKPFIKEDLKEKIEVTLMRYPSGQ